MKRATLLLIVSMTLAAACGPRMAASARIVVEQVPHGGIQPQVAVDRNGGVHIVYFTGDPAAGDLFYVVRAVDGSLSTPIRVNSEAGSAIAIGSVRGAQIAVGHGRVHVVWIGARGSDAAGLPLFYARLDPRANRFREQRNLVTWAVGLDGGGSVAADDNGTVFVAWHGNPRRTSDTGRGVYIRRSTNDGEEFSREEQVDHGDGACACCGMRAAVTSEGALHVLYRAAGDDVNRDMMLLSSADDRAFAARRLDAWKVNACPLSTAALAAGPAGLWAAWETKGNIRFSNVAGSAPAATVGTGGTSRKHPVVALNGGDALLAWIEGSGWAKGGRVAWQLYRAASRQVSESGTAGDVPRWGLAAVAPLPDGRFLILH